MDTNLASEMADELCLRIQKRLYVLEQIKSACGKEHGVFHTSGDGDDFDACVKLEEDGLIRIYSQEPGHVEWVLA